MKNRSYSELQEKLPTLWKILEQRHQRKRAGDPDATRARLEIERLLREVEAESKCQHCREIEELASRIEYLEDKERER